MDYGAHGEHSNPVRRAVAVGFVLSIRHHALKSCEALELGYSFSSGNHSRRAVSPRIDRRASVLSGNTTVKIFKCSE